MLQSSTLRPGLLVSLKSSITGNVSYIRRDLEHAKGKRGEEKDKWETERTISDPVEHEAAVKCRTNARSVITKVCSHSAFGLLCPEDNAAELEEAVAEANKIVAAFNAEAKLSRVSVYVLTGRIAPDDVEAVKAINSEVRELLEDMATGLKNLDVKKVREAASKAKSIGSMLTPDAEVRIKMAIEVARESAKKIVKAGEQASMEIDNRAIRKITEQRVAFLDLDDAKEIAKPKEAARAVDLTPVQESKPKAKAKARAIEM